MVEIRAQHSIVRSYSIFHFRVDFNSMLSHYILYELSACGRASVRVWACICMRGWMDGWVSYDEEPFDKTIRIVDSFRKCAQAMWMPTTANTIRSKRCDSCDFWFITNSDFMAFQQFPFTFVRLFFLEIIFFGFFSLFLSLFTVRNKVHGKRYIFKNG